MVAHCFTPDNQFMLSLYRNSREVCVWNNYLSKISSSRAQEELLFKPTIREVSEDYRQELELVKNKVEVVN